MDIANRETKAGFRGVAHMLLAVPKGEERKAIITGMTPECVGTGPVGITKLSKLTGLKSRYQERIDRFIAEVERTLGPLHTLALSEGYRGNAFVRQGLNGLLNSGYGDLTASRITHIGLSADTAAVTIATTDLDPAGNGTGTSIKVTANTAINTSTSTVSADQTWTQADVSWPITKIGLLRGSASTTVSNIIGGTGGSSPYNEPFTIDLTSIATWTLTMGIDVTATAS